jgi:hypothetical protein
VHGHDAACVHAGDGCTNDDHHYHRGHLSAAQVAVSAATW